MMTMTTPDKLAMASGAARAAIQTASDYVGRAAGDYGIDASDNNARILHDCIERQQDAISALWKMVDELQAQVAQMVDELQADEARRESDETAASEDEAVSAEVRHHRRMKEQMAERRRAEGWDE